MITELNNYNEFMSLDYRKVFHLNGNTFETTREALRYYKKIGSAHTDEVLTSATIAKFTQDEDLAMALVNTGAEEISLADDVELDITNNMYGEILMTTRLLVCTYYGKQILSFLTAKIVIRKSMMDVTFNGDTITVPKELYKLACLFMCMNPDEYTSDLQNNDRVFYKKHVPSDKELCAVLEELRESYRGNDELIMSKTMEACLYYFRAISYNHTVEELLNNGF